jgi:ribosomal-protein-alanine N-acetyltransferase
VRTRARLRGAQRLLLEVAEAYEGAGAFYAAHGSVELDRRRRYYRDGSDALVLRLPVAATGSAREEGNGG